MPQFHICTYATKETRGFKRFMQSCKRYDININVLGMNCEWKGLCQKLKAVRNFIESLPDNDIVMFVDAYDVHFQTNSQIILERFINLNTSFLISVEKYCSVPELILSYPESSALYRYINTGGYIGYVNAVKNILDGLGEYADEDHDQILVTRHFVNNQHLYKLDYDFDIFLTFACFGLEDINENLRMIEIDDVSQKINVPSLNKTPCVIHGPCNGRKILKRVFNRFYGKRSIR